ncbi:ABC-type transporter Mla MlaB component, partial [Paraburkholderia sp. GAS448]
MNHDTPPGLEVAAGSQGKVVRLSGQWTALALARDKARRGSAVLKLRALATEKVSQWDLSHVARMDHVGGQALWHVWGRRMPAELVALNDTQRE